MNIYKILFSEILKLIKTQHFSFTHMSKKRQTHKREKKQRKKDFPISKETKERVEVAKAYIESKFIQYLTEDTRSLLITTSDRKGIEGKLGKVDQSDE
jgi:hypothetical protein